MGPQICGSLILVSFVLITWNGNLIINWKLKKNVTRHSSVREILPDRTVRNGTASGRCEWAYAIPGVVEKQKRKDTSHISNIFHLRAIYYAPANPYSNIKMDRRMKRERLIEEKGKSGDEVRIEKGRKRAYNRQTIFMAYSRF